MNYQFLITILMQYVSALPVMRQLPQFKGEVRVVQRKLFEAAVEIGAVDMEDREAYSGSTEPGSAEPDIGIAQLLAAIIAHWLELVGVHKTTVRGDRDE